MKPKNYKTCGFTLIESLIALLIVGVALTGLVSNFSQSANHLEHIKQKTLAQLVASNLLVEKRLGPKPGLGYKEDSYKLGDKEWYWKTHTEKTPDEKLIKLTLSVFSSKKNRDAKTPQIVNITYLEEEEEEEEKEK